MIVFIEPDCFIDDDFLSVKLAAREGSVQKRVKSRPHVSGVQSSRLHVACTLVKARGYGDPCLPAREPPTLCMAPEITMANLHARDWKQQCMGLLSYFNSNEG